MADCFKLVHFHLGSQITNIRNIKDALTEAARVYAELHPPGAGLQVPRRRRRPGRRLRRLADRLRVERQLHARRNTPTTSSSASRASATRPACRTRRSSPRSGRAVVAYHSVLVFDVLGVSDFGDEQVPPRRPRRTARSRSSTCSPPTTTVNTKNVLESYHDALQALDMALNLFNLGYLPLELRGLAENLFWAVCRKLQQLVAADWTTCPRSCRASTTLLSDTYFCNFSVFQSMPDSWAIKQLFPIMPIHRLNERPTRRAVLGDITCDSDGKIDQFIDLRDVQQHAAAAPVQRRAVLPRRVPARRLPGNPRRPAQPVRRHQRRARQPRRRRRRRASTRVIKGDTVREVLDYVQFDAETLLGEAAHRRRKGRPRGAPRLRRQPAGSCGSTKTGLHGYTYLEDPRAS